ncbi:penicillin acylase family protein [Nocardioides acrostichi]|uniref:Penicillin acylase family protein n=1 Tax=Nocardioides acrostichi TaxID=2784339 RepID=A0A930V0N0_9ACTN|nr:penicillin acylase family protein [Nocardioides acrostichi]MBF4161864.1 penicillin acylase family protein [Nocardioides acrostichi]
MRISRPVLLASVAGSLAVSCVAAGATAQAAPFGAASTVVAHHDGRASQPAPDEYGSVLDILPPGADGNVDAVQLAALGPGRAAGDPTSLLSELAAPQGFFTTATPTSPPHFADQLEQYDALNTVRPDSLTDAQLPTYFKDAGLGVPADEVEHVEHPKDGVTITWDTDGVPHVQGRTTKDVAYGAGVANAETRMFLTDVLRHTGEARMAEFVGPTDADIAQDAAQLRVAAYTKAQLNRQITRLVHRSPQAARLVRSLDGYIAGMNATQERLCPATTPSVPLPGSLGLGFGADCPVEYAALQRPPQPYTRADIVSIASLVGGIFGTGGGGQYTNAIWLQQLQERFGARVGKRMYEDLREKQDPEAPVTTTLRFPYGGGPHVHPDRPGVAMPDLHPKAQALATGALVNADGSLSAPPAGAAGNQGNASTTDPKDPPSRTADQAAARGAGMLRAYGVNPIAEAHQIHGSLERAMEGELVGMSNALLVDRQHSAGHHPTAVFGPQTGYYAPQLLMEEELSGPHTQARGVSFAGTNFVIELGRGVDYAWSATSPYTDITDTVVQRLCNADGSEPSVTSTAYVDRRGRCRPMHSYEHTETGLPTLAAQGSPQQISFLVLRTDEGLVRLRTTVRGKPVAIVLKRSTYMHEVDSVLGFVGLDDPGKVHDARGFMRQASKIQYTFNWYYLDDRDIAYYSSARLPRRAPGTDLDLPRWGSARFDWRGYVGFAGHPHEIDPPKGYIVNWNNKLARGFASSSQVYGDGSVYRSRTLEDRLRDLVRRGGVHRSDLVGAMMDAATVDVRGAYVLPDVLEVIGKPQDPQDAAAVRALRSWVRSGAHRVDRDRRDGYAHQSAIDVFDTWWDPDDMGAGCSPDCGFTLPEDALRHGLGDYVDTLPEPIDDHPREGIGSAFNGISWYGYLDKDLRTTLGRRVRGGYSRSYCGPLPVCRRELRASFHAAVAQALADQDATSVDQLTYDKSRDDIVSVAGGVVGVRPIDWQNRPTFQQVVRFTGHR